MGWRLEEAYRVLDVGLGRGHRGTDIAPAAPALATLYVIWGGRRMAGDQRGVKTAFGRRSLIPNPNWSNKGLSSKRWHEPPLGDRLLA